MTVPYVPQASTMYYWASLALTRGLHVFPVKERDKVPHPAAGEWGQSASGVHTTRGHWSAYPDANIGIACAPSNLLVVDCDLAKEDGNLAGTEYEYLHSAYGPRVSGEDLLDEICHKAGGNYAADTNTYRVRTGSGGLHLYYRWLPQWPKASQASIKKGLIDIRSNGGRWGGYVLGEGSITEAGVYTAERTMEPQLPPMWLRLMVKEKVAPPRPPRAHTVLLGGKSFSGLQETVANAPEGNRNNSLVWAARTMCEEGATEQDALNILGPAARMSGLGDMEIERTIRSAYRTQMHKQGGAR